MDMKTLILLSTIPTTLFMMSTHPVSMMITIIAQTLLLCVILWMMINLSWFSYVMFLIFLGGIMVLFIYIASLASNEKFQINLQQLVYQSIMMTTFLMLFIYLSTMQLIKSNKMEFSEMIFKIYSFLLMNMTMFSIFYLIVTLIVVVKLTSFLEGPLRAK